MGSVVRSCCNQSKNVFRRRLPPPVTARELSVNALETSSKDIYPTTSILGYPEDVIKAFRVPAVTAPAPAEPVKERRMAADPHLSSQDASHALCVPISQKHLARVSTLGLLLVFGQAPRWPARHCGSTAPPQACVRLCAWAPAPALCPMPTNTLSEGHSGSSFHLHSPLSSLLALFSFVSIYNGTFSRLFNIYLPPRV